jgi:hypothetical protein
MALLRSAPRAPRLVSDVLWARAARARRLRLLSERPNVARSQSFRLSPPDPPRPLTVIPALAVPERQASRRPRRLPALGIAVKTLVTAIANGTLAIAIAVGARARPSLRSPRGVVAFHLAVNRKREEVTVSVLAVALGLAVAWLVVRVTG